MLQHRLSRRGSTRSLVSSIGNIVSSFACVLGLTLATSAVDAQAVFQPTLSTYTVASGPQGVAVADLNRDGKPDSIVANSTANSISVVLSSGGTYTVNSYSSGGGSKPVAVAVVSDFANSGLPAVAVVEQGAGSVAIYTDSAAGALTYDTSYTTGAAPTAIAVGDFNNDGIADLAVTYPGGVTVLLGSANGSFSAGAGASVGSNLVALAVGHFDTTQNLDLAVVDQASNQVDILVGNGAGGFTVGTSKTVGTKPTSVAVADFNLDEKSDLVVGNFTDGTVSVLLGNGNDTFQGQTATAAGGNVQSVVTTDVNNDGISDIVVTNASSNTVGVLIGVGNGTFGQVMTPALSGSPYGLAVLDFNRDGKPDVVVTQNSAGTVTVLSNNTLATSPLPIGRNLASPTQIGSGNMADSVAIADFNGDGIPDVVVSYLEDYTVGVMFGKGDGTFQAQTTYNVGKHPFAVAVADLNHDGHPDIVTANENDSTISVLLNNGTGGFGAATTYTVGKLPTGIAIGDLNNDGIPDLAVANFGGNDVSILIGKGDGTFTPASTPTLAGQTNPYNVVIGDFNGDGKNDIAFTNNGSATMEVCLGNGDGTFQSPVPFATNTKPTSIVTGDFNRDGNLDIAVGDSIANNISMFLGNGAGSFTASTVATLNFPVSMAVADMNGDGIPDIVNVNPNYNSVTVLLGNGDGTFTTRWQFPTGTGTAPNVAGAQPWGVAVADLNKDGRPDVVTANTIQRINLTIPAYEPALGATLGVTVANASVLLNGSGTDLSVSVTTGGPSGSGGTPVTGQISSTQSVYLNAQMTPALSGGTPTPTGSVTFEDTGGNELGIAPISVSNGIANLYQQNIGSGQHIISALYSGDTNYQPMTQVGGSLLVQVQGTPVTITITPNTFTYGSGTTFTMVGTVYGSGGIVPTGSVSIYFFTPSGQEYYVNGPNGANFTISPSGGSNASTGPLQVQDSSGCNGMPCLAVGTYQFYAVYNTGGNYPQGSSSNEQVNVTPDTPTVTLNCTDTYRTVGGVTTTTVTCDASVKDTGIGYTITSGTVDFSVTGGSATAESINNNGGTYYAQYVFTAPTADYDSDGDADFTVTATYQANGNFGTATVTNCYDVTTTTTKNPPSTKVTVAEVACSGPGGMPAARHTSMIPILGGSTSQALGQSQAQSQNSGHVTFHPGRFFNLPGGSGSGSSGSGNNPPASGNTQHLEIRPMTGPLPGNPNGGNGTGAQPSVPLGSLRLRPEMRQRHP